MAIPNQGILIDTLSLQEARASSEIENIVTTQDEMFQATLFPDSPDGGPAKEVALYRDALKRGHDRLAENQGLLTNNTIIEMFQVLKRTTGEFRATPGTALRNDASGEIVYVPPQDRTAIVAQMTALERFVNDESVSDLDPLIKMALIHHHLKASIHSQMATVGSGDPERALFDQDGIARHSDPVPQSLHQRTARRSIIGCYRRCATRAIGRPGCSICYGLSPRPRARP